MPQALLNARNAIWGRSYRSATWRYVFKSRGLQNPSVCSLKAQKPKASKILSGSADWGCSSSWFLLIQTCFAEDFGFSLSGLSAIWWILLACLCIPGLINSTAIHTFLTNSWKKSWRVGGLRSVWSGFAAAVTWRRGCLSVCSVVPRHSVGSWISKSHRHKLCRKSNYAARNGSWLELRLLSTWKGLSNAWGVTA